MKTIERAARALCKFDGHAENIRFEGAPMWQSYVPRVRALLDSVRGTAPAGTDTEGWRMMIEAALTEGDGIWARWWRSSFPDRMPRGRRPPGGGHAARFFSR